MRKIIRWSGEDWMGIWLVAMIGGGMFAFRELAIVPRATVGLCAAANAPAICAPRPPCFGCNINRLSAGRRLAWALPPSSPASAGRPSLALGIGIAAVVNYNATTGIIGAALGLIAWIGLDRPVPARFEAAYASGPCFARAHLCRQGL